MLSVITVNTAVDEDDGVNVDGISLRDAINAAVANDTINFNPASAGLNGGIIALQHGEIPFGKSLTIDASMLTSGLTIDANDPTPNTLEDPGDWHDGIRIFNITDPSGLTSVSIIGPAVGLTLTGGDPDGDGGAILAAGNLSLINCVITNNTAKAGGDFCTRQHLCEPECPVEPDHRQRLSDDRRGDPCARGVN